MQSRTRTLVLALFFVCLFASRVQAQTATYAAGYPKPSAVVGSGDILVKGSSTLPQNWTWTGSGLIIIWKAGDKGGESISGSIAVDKKTGNWDIDGTGAWVQAAIAGQSGTTYNVIVQINVKDAGQIRRTLITPLVNPIKAP